MPSRAYTSFLHSSIEDKHLYALSVNALSGLYLSSTEAQKGELCSRLIIVSMPSRAYTSFLPLKAYVEVATRLYCVNALSGLYLISTHMQLLNSVDDILCQCPLGLIPHFYISPSCLNCTWRVCVNALSGLYLISTVPLQKPRFYAVSRACFCRYLSEYSDSSRFSCMLTFWTYLMRYSFP